MSERAEQRVDPTTLAAFLAMCVFAGGNVVAVRYLTRDGDIGPFWAGASRFIVAAVLFAVIAIAQRARWPRGRALLGASLYGALAFGGFFGFAYWGLAHAPAGLAGVLLATAPLLTFLFALAHRQERFRWAGFAGAVLAIAGIAVISRVGLNQGVPFGALLAIVGAAACAAEGSIVVKAFPESHPSAMNAIGMAVGAAMLTLLTLAFDEKFLLPATGSAWAAQGYLVIAGSLGVFAFYLFVLKRWTASAVSYEFVLIPIVGVVASALILDERITRAFIAGSVLVLAGVYFGAIRRRAG